MEADESESLLLSIAAFRDLSTVNVTTLTEVILELTPSSLPREIANE